MPPTSRLARGDVLSVVTLLVTSVVIALPVVRGGCWTYIDNSVHIAEIWELAEPGNPAWSEIGFAGFPLGTLHSPLWYPLLAFLVRQGVPVAPLYCAALLVGFVAPSLALYGVARRRAAPGPSALLAYLLLVQSSAIWGIGSPLGGMWTHALSTGVVIVLADLHARPELTARQHCAAAALLAFALLTHLFALPLFGFVFVASVAVLRRRDEISRVEIKRRLAGTAVAAAASAQYWLTLLLVGNEGKAPHQALRPVELLTRLLLPSDAMYLIDHRPGESIRWDLGLVDAVPSWALLALGVVGFLRKRAARDALGATGFWFGSALLLLLFVHNYVQLPIFGPVSFRFVEGVRAGFALSAIPLVAEWPGWSSLKTRAYMAMSLVGSALGFLWGTPLRRDMPESIAEDLSEVRELGRWLREHASPDWGRVYLQDTFGHDWRGRGAALSHMPVLTRHYSGLPQLGAYYGVVPFQLRWTLSEFNGLYGMWTPSEEWVLEAMEKTNAGVLVTSNPDMDGRVARMERLEELGRVGRYTIRRRSGAVNAPIAPLTPANHVGTVEYGTNEFHFPLMTEYPRTRVLVKTSFHPWWHLEGLPGSFLRESPEGFLIVDNIPRGEFTVRLWYEPDRTPLHVTFAGWLAIALWAARVWVRSPGRGAREQSPA